MSDTYAQTDRTTATRYRNRMSYDRQAVHAILDEGYDCSVAFVVDGEPRLLPTLHVRVGDTLFLHGSSGGRMGLTARGDGVRVCVSVTLLDGIVYARSQTNHSANYRSVVVHGVARPVTDTDAKLAAMSALTDKVGTGRAADSRPPSKQELAQTAVLALSLKEAAVKARGHGVADEADDLSLPHWAGVLPVTRTFGPPQTDLGVTAAPPAYLPGGGSPWVKPVVLEGRHVRLEPLAHAHVDGLLDALADDEVWRYLPTLPPRTHEQMAEHVNDLHRRQWAGFQLPWAQIEPATGTVIGLTSYHDIDPVNRSLGIGHTVVGRRWWRTGVNTEAKLMLLEHAFETLGAEKVFWYTDIRNDRSQQAIARLGATRDGMIRKQRLRPDGTWRDTVVFAMTSEEWPAAATRLRERLAVGGSAAMTNA
ncbi:bifunctional pyridoxamine 5'-phosphate oxidase family protein/GNAT family N-acetyltransferase [Actinoplanes sp. KI2]|uniref:bifunctional pyridoxamine 5'-phosphate oxidase family protein/GNAT family N-acetyltransferase n=1 Tax=Actinoplanes sp. KI2 TaxID=2983315 RepID=UPI0021D60746|nr:bifunctional pyridoxamine 5'-phosphate oxidase family protein/GNAT family N-acetyltransferase [Actinoplanes sp. KI2]MCU7729990.1 bifunctional pyridoxamine 5'-phosphate oxidase family protein/GNAT family N-acetyltransferase [Actinoplanes sp. KI2]